VYNTVHFFHVFSLFRNIGENTELETKYENLFELTENMTAKKMSKRPNCDKILYERNSWALSLSELMRTKDFKTPLEDIKTIEESFHKFFIKIKLKYK